MILEEIFLQAIRLTPQDRRAQWIAHGAEAHPREVLVTGDSGPYCAKCWTAFTSISLAPINPPVEIGSPTNYEDAHLATTLQLQGMSRPETDELRRGLALWTQVTALSSEAFIEAVRSVHGPELATEFRDLMIQEGAAAEDRIRVAGLRTKVMGKMPDEPQ